MSAPSDLLKEQTEREKSEERTRLRDQFASAALIGLLARDYYRLPAYMELVSSRSFAIADAMLEAREK